MSSHLADQLIQERVITFDQLKAALEEKQRTGHSLEETLVSLGYLSEFQIAQYLGRLHGVPPVDLESIDVDEDTLNLIPKDFAVTNLIVPIRLKGSTLVVALPDPSNLMLVDDLRFVTGFNIEACVATERVIRNAIVRFYRVSPPGSEPTARVGGSPEAAEPSPEEPQSHWESGEEGAFLRREEGGFEFFTEESKGAEDLVLDEPPEQFEELVEESPSQPRISGFFSPQESASPQSPPDVATEEEVYEIDPEEVEVPPSFSPAQVEPLSEEEPGVYEISEEVLEETGGSLGHIEESGTISIPPEFLAPSQRGPRPGVYEAVPEEVNPPRSFLLTEEAPSAPTGTEEKEVLSVLEPPQIEPQPERVEADESVVIDFYSPPEEALPYEVSSEEAESKATQEASREEPPQGGSRYPGDSHPTAAAPHLAKEPMREGYMGTVMVVDDSPTVQKIVTITLEREGYRVVGVDNAMQALARFEELVPDVILLDINLPYIDGYQLCKIIKGNPLTKNASVIMLTGKDGFFDKVRGKLAGAAEYITKPFQPSHLIETVRRHTRGRL